MTYDEFCETFFDIPGFEGYYKISPEWEIASCDRWVQRKKSGAAFLKGAIMKPHLSEDGYLKVEFHVNKRYHLSVHRLMALTFIPNPDNKPCVNHLSGVKLDNSILNLEWVTHKENSAHAYKMGLKTHKVGKENKKFGVKTPNAPHVKIVLDTATGVYYFGVAEAAESKGMKEKTLRCKLLGHSRNNTSLIYV